MAGALPALAAGLVPSEPADVTFVDAEGVVRHFSEYRIFGRPMSCLDRDVLSCHREVSRPGIERMLAEFRDGWRSEADFLSRKSGRDVDVRYLAVRDAHGCYLGCLEIAQWTGASAAE
ncbi:MAG TPA: PAS domain-containing protein [Coriobacteriia bacterium]